MRKIIKMVQDITSSKIQGFVKIKDVTDPDSHKVVLEKKNQIHFENMSIALAKSLAHRPDGHIHEMHFGNGGSTVSGIGTISYSPPNVEGQNSDLYNPTYFKVIDDQSAQNLDPETNFMEVRHTRNNTYTDIKITATLGFNEPADQQAFDDTVSIEDKYVFDEIGLKTFAGEPGQGLLITHVIFSPVQKSLNRIFEIVYTIRIALV
jgi:hypothetical protein